MSVSSGYWAAARAKRARGEVELGYSTQLSDTAEAAACGDGEPEVQSLKVRADGRPGRAPAASGGVGGLRARLLGAPRV